MILQILVEDFVNTSIQIQNVGNKDMHNLYVCIFKFVNTGRRFGQYQKTIWPTQLDDLANTGIWFRQYQQRYIFQDLFRFEVEIVDSKNIGGS